MRFLFLLILIAPCGFIQAQHTTLRFTDEPIRLNQQSVLLVPFESKMFQSDINKELALTNNLNSQEIIQRFTNGVDQSILFAFQKKCNVNSFYQLDDQESTLDLKYIYDNLKLEYELVSVSDEKNGLGKITQKFKKKGSDDYKGGEIREGEIYTERDNRERYMKAIVQENKMLDSMHFKFNNDYFLFVTELDIKNVYTDAVSMQHNGYDRELKLHYTLYFKDGTILSTGISRTRFPSNLNDIDKIISGYFPILAQNIYNDLFPDESAKEDSKPAFKLWK